ncbi:Hypothetical_protein [Hexamita inflata]|uniref:Hypothetical_protein n=1 Tax=Hexamita inflata TaxID=28002 RepID=A0AA86QBK8_9EUKA|nr:Hypothetical protein HINF_LOCUS37639 [Hexamita inflata]CAI9949997.1 Hypothetical protein HINF_LOCUS37642 [Hexamita inflata]
MPPEHNYDANLLFETEQFVILTQNTAFERAIPINPATYELQLILLFCAETLKMELFKELVPINMDIYSDVILFNEFQLVVILVTILENVDFWQFVVKYPTTPKFTNIYPRILMLIFEFQKDKLPSNYPINPNDENDEKLFNY